MHPWEPPSRRASPYLMHMCAYLALNYVTSSFFYFEKTLVVATGGRWEDEGCVLLCTALASSPAQSLPHCSLPPQMHSMHSVIPV